MKKLHIALLVASFIIPSISFASIDTNLKYGSRGVAVTELQDFLIAKGFLSGQTSGNFFSLTRKAVVAYQDSVGLPITGFVGPMTRAKINDDLSATNAPAVSAEITETGTTTSAVILTHANTVTTPTLSGCTSTSLYSATTGQPCHNTLQPILNLPAGCTALSGYSITTGALCNSIAPAVTNATTATPVDFCKNIEGTQTYVPSGMTLDSTGNCFAKISTNQNSQTTTQTQSVSTTANPAPSCVPNWQCSTWNACTSLQQIRTCNDSNSCNISAGKPTIVQSCSAPTSTITPTQSTDDTLSNLNVDGTLIANFSSNSLSYNYLLPAGTILVPFVTATTRNTGASISITQATSLTGTSTILVLAQDRITSQRYTVSFNVTPKLTVASDTGTNIPSYAVVGSTDNNIMGFKISTDSSQGVSLTGSSIRITDSIFNNTSGVTSFANLTLWQGGIKISGPAQITLGTNGVGTVDFPLSASSVVVVKDVSPLVFQVRGDVNSVGTSLFALNSLHNFSITDSSVVGVWQYLNSPMNIPSTGSADSTSIKILPYYATLNVTGTGNTIDTIGGLRIIHLNQTVASILAGADSSETGGLTINSVILRFTGNGLFNQNNPMSLRTSSAVDGGFTVNFLDASGSLVDSKRCVPKDTITGQDPSGLWIGTGTCYVTLTLNKQISSGGSIVDTLQTYEPVIQKVDTGNGDYQNVKLFLDDVIWTDGTTQNIHWNSTNQSSQVFNYTYQ